MHNPTVTNTLFIFTYRVTIQGDSNYSDSKQVHLLHGGNILSTPQLLRGEMSRERHFSCFETTPRWFELRNRVPLLRVRRSAAEQLLSTYDNSSALQTKLESPILIRASAFHIHNSSTELSRTTVKIISKRLLDLCKRSTKLGKRLPQLWKRLLKQCRVSKRLTKSSRC